MDILRRLPHPRSGLLPTLIAIGILAVVIPGASALSGGGAPRPDPLPAEKQAVEAFEAAFRAAAPRRMKPPLGVETPPPAASEEPPIQGIVEWLDAPYPAAEFVPRNSWGGYVGSSFVRVYAGSAPGDPAPGMLAIITTPVDPITRALRPDARAGRFVRTPGGTGPVRISAASGDRLTLTPTGGPLLVFDVATGAFLSR